MVLVHGGGGEGLEVGVVLDAVLDVSFSRPRQDVNGQITTELHMFCDLFVCISYSFFETL